MRLSTRLVTCIGLLVLTACPSGQHTEDELLDGCIGTSSEAPLRVAYDLVCNEDQRTFVDAVFTAVPDSTQQFNTCATRASVAELLARSRADARMPSAQRILGLRPQWASTDSGAPGPWARYPFLDLLKQMIGLQPDQINRAFTLLEALQRPPATDWPIRFDHLKRDGHDTAVQVMLDITMGLSGDQVKAIADALRAAPDYMEQRALVRMTVDTHVADRAKWAAAMAALGGSYSAMESMFKGVSWQRTELAVALRGWPAGRLSYRYAAQLPATERLCAVRAFVALVPQFQQVAYYSLFQAVVGVFTYERVEAANATVAILTKLRHAPSSHDAFALLQAAGRGERLKPDGPWVAATAAVTNAWGGVPHEALSKLRAYDAAQLAALQQAIAADPLPYQAAHPALLRSLDWLMHVPSPAIGQALRAYTAMPSAMRDHVLASVATKQRGAMVLSCQDLDLRALAFAPRRFVNWIAAVTGSDPAPGEAGVPELFRRVSAALPLPDLEALSHRHSAQSFRSALHATAPLQTLTPSAEWQALLDAAADEHHPEAERKSSAQVVARLRQRCGQHTGVVCTYTAWLQVPARVRPQVEAAVVEARPICENMGASIRVLSERVQREHTAQRVQALVQARPGPASFTTQEATLFVEHEHAPAAQVDAQALHHIVRALAGLNDLKTDALQAIAGLPAAERVSVARILGLLPHSITQANLSSVVQALGLMADPRREHTAVLVDKQFVGIDVAALPDAQVADWLNVLGALDTAYARQGLLMSLSFAGMDGKTPMAVLRYTAEALTALAPTERGPVLSAAKRLMQGTMSADNKEAVLRAILGIPNAELGEFVDYCIVLNDGVADPIPFARIRNAANDWRWGYRGNLLRQQEREVHQAHLVEKVAGQMQILKDNFPERLNTQRELDDLEAFIIALERDTPRDNPAFARANWYTLNVFEAALRVLRGPSGGFHRPIRENELYGTSRVGDLTALMWHAIKRYPEHAQTPPLPQDAAKEKKNLELTFVRAMSTAYLQGFNAGAGAGVLCAEGKIQRMVEAVEGYLVAAPGQAQQRPVIVADILATAGPAFVASLEERQTWRTQVCGQSEDEAEAPTHDDLFGFIGGLQAEFEATWPDAAAPQRRDARDALRGWLAMDYEQFEDALDAHWQQHAP